MKRRLHIVAGILFLLVLLYDFYAWGGLAHTDRLGPVLVEAASRDVSFGAVYTPVGRALVGAVGMEDAAAASAQEMFATREARLLENRPAFMDNLLSDLPFAMRTAYYGAPLLLALFAVLWWRRPRVVHVMGR